MGQRVFECMGQRVINFYREPECMGQREYMGHRVSLTRMEAHRTVSRKSSPPEECRISQQVNMS